MKKFTNCIIFLFFNIIAFAQLNVINYIGAEKYLGEINNIKRISFKNNKMYVEPHGDGDLSYIKRKGDVYYLCTRESIESYNNRTYQYETFIIGEERSFCLGKSKAASLKTLSDLLSIYKKYEAGSKITVNDALGKIKFIFVEDKSNPLIKLRTKEDDDKKYLSIQDHGLYSTDDIEKAIKIVKEN